MNIYVLTSNEYLKCLPGFAYLFNKFWSETQAVKVVRYEIRPQGLPRNFTNYAIGAQSRHSWSSGVVKWLSDTPDDIILLVLEDYYLTKPVDGAAIGGLYQMMVDDKSIAKIDLSGDRMKFAHREYNDYLVASQDNAGFQTSLQAALWRRDYLRLFLRPGETPWQFEKKGTSRVKRARKAGTFDGKILGVKKPLLNYVNAVGGEGSKPGVFDKRKFPPGIWAQLEGRGVVTNG